jgi:hypothetical protein
MDKKIESIADLEAFVKSHMDYSVKLQLEDPYWKGVYASYMNVYNAIQELKANFEE